MAARLPYSNSGAGLYENRCLPAFSNMAATLNEFPSSTFKPMSELHRDTIRKCRAMLVQDLDVTEIMDHMIQQGIINDHKQEIIMAKENRIKQVGAFLDALMRSGSHAFDVFCEALENSYRHLADVLKAKLSEPHYEYFGNPLETDSISHPFTAALEDGEQDPPLLEMFDPPPQHHAEVRFDSNEAYQSSSISSRDMEAACNPIVHNCHESGVDYLTIKKKKSDTANVYPTWEDNGSSLTSENNAGEDHEQSNEEYLDDVANRVTEAVCYHSSGTQSLICTKSCMAIVITRDLTRTSDEDAVDPRDVSNLHQANRDGNYANSQVNSTKQEKVLIQKGEALFLEESQKSFFSKAQTNASYVRVWDQIGRLLLVPARAMTKYGDPYGEPWFYPIPISAQQAGQILKPKARPGVFLVYRPYQRNETQCVLFNLSLLVKKGSAYTVMHFHVNSKPRGQVQILEGSFSCIQELIAHHKTNKGGLPCRLRLPPKEVDRKIVAGEQYNMEWHIDEMNLFPDDRTAAIQLGKFGNVVQGIYDLILVAVKYRSSSHRVNPWSYENFFEEAQILSQLDHRNIVQLQGFSFASRMKPFIVMEYLPGGTLQDAIRNKKIDKNLENIVKLFKQLLMALSYLESMMYVIHCGVAAQNILLGESGCLKLADFGMAKMVTEDCFMMDETDKLLTRWSAPEILRDRCCSTKSDVWAAGVVFWELLSDGDVEPYGKLSLRQLIHILYSGGRLACPAGRSVALQDMFCVIAHRCWNISPKDRSSPSDLWADISHRIYTASGNMRQAALSEGLDLPYIHLTEKHMRKGTMPKELQKRVSSVNNYYYADIIP